MRTFLFRNRSLFLIALADFASVIVSPSMSFRFLLSWRGNRFIRLHAMHDISRRLSLRLTCEIQFPVAGCKDALQSRHKLRLMSVDNRICIRCATLRRVLFIRRDKLSNAWSVASFVTLLPSSGASIVSGLLSWL
ncbi:hypothetical protein CFIMG_002278RA [Ceratocystis fimbriata CBS 114723]|uniref:Uncharacterized protein n=1 Tax=Ceratocystis fimbriata CBS 114723 TaxID=1035309 RepID=A0A2C5XB43_9PEZI|nr:hypothetical protein CFIMG_002278RA [Ceratocystis fimbriata CBS 114723]